MAWERKVDPHPGVTTWACDGVVILSLSVTPGRRIRAPSGRRAVQVCPRLIAPHPERIKQRIKQLSVETLSGNITKVARSRCSPQINACDTSLLGESDLNET